MKAGKFGITRKATPKGPVMEWFTSIASSLSGLPWWAVLLVVLLSVALTKGVEAVLRVWGFQFDWKKYTDAQRKVKEDALVAELKLRIDKLEAAITRANEKLDTATAAHLKCEIEQERLRGELNVMKEKVSALERHDRANKEQVAMTQEDIRKLEAKVQPKEGA